MTICSTLHSIKKEVNRKANLMPDVSMDVLLAFETEYQYQKNRIARNTVLYQELLWSMSIEERDEEFDAFLKQSQL